jgi:flavodoxin
MMKKIDDAANMWNKTRDPQYKKLWYSLIEEFADGKDINNVNTTVRWNVSKREVRFGKTNGSKRVSNVCGRSSRSDSDLQRIRRWNEKRVVSQ